jgi:hypothetical protein
MGVLRLSRPGWMRSTPAARSRRTCSRVTLAVDVGLELVEQAQVVAGIAQPGQHLAEVAVVEDVVDHLEVELTVPLRERRQILDDARGALAAKRHAAAVEAAEGTVRLGPPPAAARALVHELDAGRELRGKARLGQTLEVLLESRQRGVVQRHGRLGPGHGDRASAVAVAEPGARTDWGAGDEVGDEPGKDRFGLTAHHHVDPGEGPVQRRAHGTVAVGAPEHDDERGIALLEELGQDE